MQPQNSKRPLLVDGPWNGGLDSLLHPSVIDEGCYAWSQNVTNRGGIIETRPGKRRVQSFLGQNAQGMTEFRTLDDTQYLVVVIDGCAWWSLFPFSTFQRITGIRLNSAAKRVYMTSAVQAAMLVPTPADGSLPKATSTGVPGDGTVQPTGNGSTETLVILPKPINWLIFQDGVSNPAWWDGSNAYQPRVPDTASGLPIGSAMVASGNRLWLARGNVILASDLLNPLRFTERTYLAESDGFRFPRDITALLDAPSDKGIFVFTSQSIHTLQSSIQQRTEWQNTANFQQDVTTEVGAASQSAVTYQHGLPWIFSAKGLLSLDRAQNSNQTSQLTTQDGEMIRSKNRLSPDLSGVCLGSFENLLLVSVPASSRFNRHTWIMDAGLAQKLKFQMNPFATQPPVWSSCWTGTYPAAFQKLTVSGVERLYELAYSSGTIPDANGVPAGIHLWENFQQNAVDSSASLIRCRLETRIFMMPGEELFQAKFVEFHALNVRGLATVEVWVAGLSGGYQLVGRSTLNAQVGPFGNPTVMPLTYQVTRKSDTILESFRGQNRYLRTPEITLDTVNQNVDTSRPALIDKGFQVMIRWSGRMALRNVKFYFSPVTESPTGACMPDETATTKTLLEANA